MLDRLLETGAQRKKSSWGAAASVIVHGAVITLAVAATATGNPAPPERIIRDPIIPIRVVPTIEHRPTSQGGGSGSRLASGPLAPPSILLPGAIIDIDAPLPDRNGPITVAGAALLSEIAGTRGRGPAVPGGTGVADDATIDTPVTTLADNAPAYPEMLRSAGIAGTVRVQFVVDTTGRAEPSSIRVLESTHELFTRSVLASLRRARFTPGAVAGHRVRTLVERSFRFDIAGNAR